MGWAKENLRSVFDRTSQVSVCLYCSMPLLQYVPIYCSMPLLQYASIAECPYLLQYDSFYCSMPLSIAVCPYLLQYASIYCSMPLSIAPAMLPVHSPQPWPAGPRQQPLYRGCAGRLFPSNARRKGDDTKSCERCSLRVSGAFPLQFILTPPPLTCTAWMLTYIAGTE